MNAENLTGLGLPVTFILVEGIKCWHLLSRVDWPRVFKKPAHFWIGVINLKKGILIHRDSIVTVELRPSRARHRLTAQLLKALQVGLDGETEAPPSAISLDFKIARSLVIASPVLVTAPPPFTGR